MSVRFYIGPIDPSSERDDAHELTSRSSLKIDYRDYRSKLLARWPSASEWPSKSFAGGVFWTLDEYNLHGVEVHLHRDLQHVAFTLGSVNFLEFILWHRAYVPAQYPLYLFNTSDMKGLPLPPEITREGLIQLTGWHEDDLVKDSPLNGSWDGSFTPEAPERVPAYRCTLHLHVYRHQLKGELLLTERGPRSGSIHTELEGEPAREGEPLHLYRGERTNIYGEGVAEPILAFQALILEYQEGQPPALEGEVVSGGDASGKILGRLELRRRGLYDPPPLG